MKTFGQLRYNRPLRDYQQRVLNRFATYASNGKVNIVAAPGSGKTVLGLEMICRLGRAALVLSPSVTVRQQWGQRFAEGFLPEDEDANDYISHSLRTPKLLTSTTYQALHAAWTRGISRESSEDGPDGAPAEPEDFSDFDILAAIKEAGIGTICLDEAHHLRAEWHRALEAFIRALDGQVIIISLTATPPYDSTAAEWKRYIDLCGEIDEEIYVPELVKQGILCPHQDYIHFSYPTASERELLRRHRRQAAEALADIRDAGIVPKALDVFLKGNAEAIYQVIYIYEAQVRSLFRLAKFMGRDVDHAWRRAVAPHGRLGRYSIDDAECGLQLVLDRPDLFGQETAGELEHILARHGMLKHRRVKLRTNRKLDRTLVASMGKLGSIQRIAMCETASMGAALRMVILADYIRADLTGLIGRATALDQMGVVPIFEALRRTDGIDGRIALLSGSLVIVPVSSEEGIRRIAAEKGVTMRFRPIPGAADVPYEEAVFSNSNQERVAVMTEALTQGLVRILVGTKALLGEGWDSPCVNTLVLASAVSTFMLSNQLRGRAIRTDPAMPDKTADIWYLVTVEPPIDPNDKLSSFFFADELSQDEAVLGSDWDTLVRRFDCFVGPVYDGPPEITSGIERVSIIRPPFTERGIEEIDRQMEMRAFGRPTMAAQWQGVLKDITTPELHERVVTSPNVGVGTFEVLNGLALALSVGLLSFLGWMLRMLTAFSYTGADETTVIALLIALAIIAVAMVRLSIRFVRRLSPKRRMQSMAEALLAAMRSMGLMSGTGGRVMVRSDPAQSSFQVSLEGTTLHDRHLFAEAVAQMCSPIDNPSYVLVENVLRGTSGTRNYRQSFACPAVMGTRAGADALAEELERTVGSFEVVSTRSLEGRATLWKCRERSLVNLNDRLVRAHRVV